MMKFCSITPLKNLDLMYENECVMLLAHLSSKSSLYRDYSRNNTNYKIMDNSIIELGEAFSMEQLINEAIECDVDEIILPDVFEDGSATLMAVKNSIDWLKQHNLIGRFKLMAVCHGKGPMEFTYTFDRLNEMSEIDVIGVPKVATTWMTSRVGSAETLCELTKKQIHLLGCWDSLSELKELSQNTSIRSMDTCMPALLSIYNMNTFDKRNGLKIDLENDEVNIERYRRIMEDVEKYIN